MVEHIHRAYDDELESLTAELSRMGGLAEVEVVDSIRAITRRDVALAQAVIGRPRGQPATALSQSGR